MNPATKTNKPAGFAELARKMERVVDESNEPVEQVHRALDLVEDFLQRRDSLDLTQFEPCNTHYARHLIHRDPKNRFTLLCLVWKAGQGTPIHDHDGTWGVYGVLRHKMRFTNYAETTRDGKPTLARICSTVATAGSATIVLPPYCDIHKMQNPGPEETSYTLHCYGKELENFNIFQPEGGLKRAFSPKYDSYPYVE